MALQLLLLLALAALCRAEIVSLSFQVDPQKEECVYEDLPAGAEVDAQVMVYRGGKLDVKFRVESPSREVMYDRLIFSNIDDSSGAMLSTIVKKGTTFIVQKPGVYSFCLDNRMARWTAKVLTIDIDIRDPNDPLAKAEKEAIEARQAAFLTGSDVDPKMAVTLMRAATNRIHSKLAMVENDQMYHYHREKRHRNTLESTNSRVQWWSVGESLIVCAAAGLQVFLVRTWFNKQALPGA